MRKTTVNLRPEVEIRLRNAASATGKTWTDLINELLLEALLARVPEGFASHACGEADVEDLGENAERYLRERNG